MQKMSEHLSDYIDELEMDPPNPDEEERWIWTFVRDKGGVTLHCPSGCGCGRGRGGRDSGGGGGGQ